MSLITGIQSIVNTLNPDGTFFLSSKFKANRSSFDVSSTNTPLVILDNELPKDCEIAKNNNFLENTRLVITILKFDDPLSTDIQQNVIVEDCEALARRIIFNIFQLFYVRPTAGIQNYAITPAFNVFATSMSGCIIDMRVRVSLVTDVCLI